MSQVCVYTSAIQITENHATPTVRNLSSTSIVLIVVVCISCNLLQFSNICGRVTATLCLSGLLLLCEVHKNSDKLILIIIVLRLYVYLLSFQVLVYLKVYVWKVWMWREKE